MDRTVLKNGWVAGGVLSGLTLVADALYWNAQDPAMAKNASFLGVDFIVSLLFVLGYVYLFPDYASKEVRSKMLLVFSITSIVTDYLFYVVQTGHQSFAMFILAILGVTLNYVILYWLMGNIGYTDDRSTKASTNSSFNESYRMQ